MDRYWSEAHGAWRRREVTVIPNLNLRSRLANWRARRACGGPPLPLMKPATYRRISRGERILLGAGSTTQPGWVSTDQNTLDLAQRAQFRRYWAPNTRTAFCAEHVWEHLDDSTARAAVTNCFEFLRPGGTLRIAVPDGNHPSAEYREHVRPGGSGPGADDHKVLHTSATLVPLMEAAGFRARLVEWWDESGEFHAEPWSDEQGHIARSARNDRRNADGELRYTSLIVDGAKP
jgi:predicted SAM-dependent methyltransferase